MTNSELKREVRKRRVIELRCVGLTQAQICEKLREDGFSISERTVWEDLHSATAEEFIEELKRRQLADITLASDDYEIRLKYRDLLLDKIMPRKVEQKTESKVDVIVNDGKDIASLLAKYDTLFNGVEKTTPPQDSPPKQVDPPQTNTETS
jgi:hypothetical protein